MRLIIGIDPDIKKSGFAVSDPESDRLQLHTKTFFEIMHTLDHIKSQIKHVYIEAGWLNEVSNFHRNKFGQKFGQKVSDRISKNVGENHAAGKLLVQMMEYLEIPHTLVKPTAAKWTPQMFFGATQIKTRNQEQIDAAVLIIGRTK